MTILVTGANGFIGRHLCDELLRRGIIIRKTARSNTGSENEELRICDLNNDDSLDELVIGCETVIHLAGRAHQNNDESLEIFLNANQRVTQRLAEASARNGVSRFIYLSSIKVNGESTEINKPFTNLDSPSPQDNYGKSKLAAEMSLKAACHGNSMDYAIIRPPLVYGSGNKANFAALISSVKRGVPLPVAKIQNRRSIVGINNLVDLIITVASERRVLNETFLISDESDFSTAELIAMIAKATNRKSRSFYLPIPFLNMLGVITGRSGEITKLTYSLTVDSSHTTNTLNWRPPFSTFSEIVKAVQ